jgi:heme-degrading monooxygenase HmoA
MSATPGAGVVVLFRSRRTADDPEGYEAMVGEMIARARGMPGFVDFRHYEAGDGERISIVWWESEELMRAWRDDARHGIAQTLGRERWYESFHIDVAHVVRSYGFRREG